jgi:hypothetical protein
MLASSQNVHLNDVLSTLQDSNEASSQVHLKKIIFLSPDEKTLHTLSFRDNQSLQAEGENYPCPGWLPLEIELSIGKDPIPLCLTPSGLKFQPSVSAPEQERADIFLKKWIKVQKQNPLSLLSALCEQRTPVHLTFQHLESVSFKPSLLSLISWGFLHQTGIAQTLVCSQCSPSHFAPVQKQAGGDYTLMCPTSGNMVLPPEVLRVYSISWETFFKKLALKLDIPSCPSEELVEDTFWFLGDGKFHKRNHSFYFARHLNHSDVFRHVYDAYLGHKSVFPGLILTFSQISNQHLWFPGHYRLLSFTEFFSLRPQGFCFVGKKT